MKLSPKDLQAARHLLQHTIRIRNHEVENPDHYGDEHRASLARYKAKWAGLDPEQRAAAVAELQRQREATIAAAASVEVSGVADLHDDAIASAITYLDSEG